MLRPDPNEWANKKKAAMERAKQLRQERQQAEEGYSFKPQVNNRPAYLDKRSGSAGGGGDSLDHLTSNGRTDDIMDQPLPGAKNYNIDGQASELDTLGREVRKFPVGKSRVDTKKDLEYKSQFLQQYENKHISKHQQQYELKQAEAPVANHHAAKESDDLFFGSLRGGDDGGGWNNDTTFGGFESVSNRSKMPSSGSKEKNPVGKTDVAHARSRLSLLKSKMQKLSAAPNGESPGQSSQASLNSNGGLLRSNSAMMEGRDDPYNIDSFRSEGDVESKKPTARAPRRRDINTNDQSSREPDFPRSAPVQQKSSSRSNVSGHDENSRATPRNDPRSGPPPPRRAQDAPQKRHAPSASYQSEYPDEQEGQYLYTSAKAGAKKQPPVPSGYSSGISDDLDAYPSEAAYDGHQLECPDCHRRFNPIPYEKHVKICAKVFLQKRKVFDSSKMRVEDNPELLKILKQTKKEEAMKAKREKAAATKGQDRPIGGGGDGGESNSKWKQQSSAFREAMRAARQVSQAQAKGEPLPPPVISAPDPSLIPCPHCGRRFNDKAAERHIPQCQNIRAKPTSLKRGQGGAGGVNGSIAGAARNGAPAPMNKKIPVKSTRR